MDVASFLSDEKTVDAVSFCYGVIGETARHVPEEVVAADPDLPWPEMGAMRKVVVPEDVRRHPRDFLGNSARGPPSTRRSAERSASRRSTYRRSSSADELFQEV